MQFMINSITYSMEDLHTLLFNPKSYKVTLYIYKSLHIINHFIPINIFIPFFYYQPFPGFTIHIILASTYIIWFITFICTRISYKPIIKSNLINKFFDFTSAFIITLTLFVIKNTCM